MNIDVIFKEKIKDEYKIPIDYLDENFVQNVIRNHIKKMSFPTENEYFIYALSFKNEMDNFVSDLNIRYSTFFRDEIISAVIKKHLFPCIIQKKEGKKTLRIWTAGSAGGQEAYSLGMILDDIFRSQNMEARYEIFASDWSNEEIEKAQKGCFTEEQLGNIRFSDIKTYFSFHHGKYYIIDKIKNHIHFLNYDLLDSTTYGPKECVYVDFDLVFCMNVLYYYKESVQIQILKKLSKSIKLDGYLILDEIEKDVMKKIDGYVQVYPKIAVYQKKR